MNGVKYPGFDRQAGWYQKPFLSLLDLIAEKGYIIEINCKNRMKNGQLFPHLESFRELNKRKIPVMVNSDCHETDLVNDGRHEALALLKEAGFSVTRELVNGRWDDVEIL
jgi:histidinol-phosphatase (PHP family)